MFHSPPRHDGLHLDRFAERAPQQVLHAGDQPADVHDLRLQRLARDRRRAAGASSFAPRATPAMALLTRRSALRVAGDVRRQQLQVAADDLQQIVEVVSDAAGELADRFKLLRALERDLGRAPVGNLADDARFKGFVELSERRLGALALDHQGCGLGDHLDQLQIFLDRLARLAVIHCERPEDRA